VTAIPLSGSVAFESLFSWQNASADCSNFGAPPRPERCSSYSSTPPLGSLILLAGIISS
jgi:hypothetical protein